MSGRPILTFPHFPPELQRYVRGLRPIPIPMPAAFASHLRIPVRTQWYDRHGEERLRHELEELGVGGYAENVSVASEGDNRSIVLRGFIGYKPLMLPSGAHLLAYGFAAWIPPDYPVHQPKLYFVWERKVRVGSAQLRGPYSVVDAPYDPPRIHHYDDGMACISELDAVARTYGVTGWDPLRHTWRVYLGWAGRYLANLEAYRSTGTWPDDHG